MTKMTVYKSNEVIEAGYKLTLNEQKIILACIAKNNPTKPLSVETLFEITAKEFSDLTGVDIDHAYKALQETAKTLLKRTVTIMLANQKIKRIQTNWISSIAYMTDSGTIALRFAFDMLPYLSELKEKFTKYELQNIGGMKSSYGIRLYELLTQYRSFGRREFQIEWLKSQFEIEDKYKLVADFRRYVIEVALDDINAHSDLKVHEPIYTKTGRKVTGVTFDFKEKQKLNSQKQKKNLEPAGKPITQAAPIDNVQHYADLLKRAGGDAKQAIINTMPIEVKQVLINRGIL